MALVDPTLPPVVQEVVIFARKIARYLTGETLSMSTADGRFLFGALVQDRALAASLVTCLIGKLLSLSGYDDKMDLAEVVTNVLLEKPILPEAERSRNASVRLDVRKLSALRHALLLNIYYIVFHCQLDVSHYAVNLAHKRWMTDAVRESEFSAEDDLNKLMSSSAFFQIEYNLKELVARACALVPQTREEMTSLFFNGHPGSLRCTSDMLASSYLLDAVRRGDHSDVIVTATIHSLLQCQEAAQFYALHFMIREMLARAPAVTAEQLDTLRSALRPFIVWPKPICDAALQLLAYVDMRQRSPGVVSCMHFLEDHPELLGAARISEKVHVIVNARSQFGAAVRDLVQTDQSAAAEHAQRTRFLYLVFRTVLGIREAPSLHAVPVEILARFFQKAVDIVLKAARSSEPQGGAGCASALKELLKAVEEHLRSSGAPQQTVDVSDVVDGVTELTIEWEDLDEGPFSVHADRGLRSDEMQEVGGAATLERILQRYRGARKPVHLRVAIVGGDATVQNVACGYAYLQQHKKELFENVHMAFYVIPAGKQNRFAHCIGLTDLWYGRQVLLGMRAATLLLPSLARKERRAGAVPGAAADQPATDQDLRDYVTKRMELLHRRSSATALEKIVRTPTGGTTPGAFMRNVMEHYLRHGVSTLPLRLWQVEVTFSLPTGVVQKRTVPLIYSLEVGQRAYAAVAEAADPGSARARRVSVAGSTLTKSARFVAPEVALKFSEMNVGGVAVQSPAVAPKAYFSIQVSAFPRTAEHVPIVKPQANCLELYLLDADAGRKASKRGAGLIEDGTSHFINAIEIEGDASKRQFDVLIDNELVMGVHKLKLQALKDTITPAEPGHEPDLVMNIATFVPTALM